MNSIVTMIINDLPEQDRKELTGKSLKAYLEEKYGSPQVINSSLMETESVFEIGDKKVGIIEDAKQNITGYSIYRGAIPDTFIQKQTAPCTNGYSRTTTVTTTSLTIPVSIFTWLFGGGPVVVGLALANFIAHNSNVSTAKAAACAPCTPPCTCTATTVAGTAGAIITPVRVWGVPVSATATHVCNTTITANCS
ncbi:hypothetical protein OAP18_01340 [Gammaproteobacteria bacterium]|nr:hypothetical protein [Gammaproteobacteria bacterium]